MIDADKFLSIPGSLLNYGRTLGWVMCKFWHDHFLVGGQWCWCVVLYCVAPSWYVVLVCSKRCVSTFWWLMMFECLDVLCYPTAWWLMVFECLHLPCCDVWCNSQELVGPWWMWLKIKKQQLRSSARTHKHLVRLFCRIGVVVMCYYYVMISIVVVCYIVVYIIYGGCEVIQIKCIDLKTRVFDTNRRNKGLISVDRRTSLLSYLQYLVPYQSRLQRIYHSQWPIDD